MLLYFETFENWTAAACSRMKSNTTPSGFCWCFHIPCIWAFFPPGEIRQNHSSNIINNTGLPSACNCRHSKATHPQKTPRVKIDREILNNREIFRVNAATPRKNMSPVCSGGLLLEISEYKASILPYLGYENPFKMFHPSFPQWWG